MFEGVEWICVAQDMSGWGGEEERWSVLHTVMNLRFALGADLLTADRMLCFQ